MKFRIEAAASFVVEAKETSPSSSSSSHSSFSSSSVVAPSRQWRSGTEQKFSLFFWFSLTCTVLAMPANRLGSSQQHLECRLSNAITFGNFQPFIFAMFTGVVHLENSSTERERKKRKKNDAILSVKAGKRIMVQHLFFWTERECRSSEPNARPCVEKEPAKTIIRFRMKWR